MALTVCYKLVANETVLISEDIIWFPKVDKMENELPMETKWSGFQRD